MEAHIPPPRPRTPRMGVENHLTSTTFLKVPPLRNSKTLTRDANITNHKLLTARHHCPTPVTTAKTKVSWITGRTRDAITRSRILEWPFAPLLSFCRDPHPIKHTHIKVRSKNIELPVHRSILVKLTDSPLIHGLVMTHTPSNRKSIDEKQNLVPSNEHTRRPWFGKKALQIAYGKRRLVSFPHQKSLEKRDPSESHAIFSQSISDVCQKEPKALNWMYCYTRVWSFNQIH